MIDENKKTSPDRRNKVMGLFLFLGTTEMLRFIWQRIERLRYILGFWLFLFSSKFRTISTRQDRSSSKWEK